MIAVEFVAGSPGMTAAFVQISTLAQEPGAVSLDPDVRDSALVPCWVCVLAEATFVREPVLVVFGDSASLRGGPYCSYSSPVSQLAVGHIAGEQGAHRLAELHTAGSDAEDGWPFEAAPVQVAAEDVAEASAAEHIALGSCSHCTRLLAPDEDVGYCHSPVRTIGSADPLWEMSAVLLGSQ